MIGGSWSNIILWRIKKRKKQHQSRNINLQLFCSTYLLITNKQKIKKDSETESTKKTGSPATSAQISLKPGSWTLAVHTFSVRPTQRPSKYIIHHGNPTFSLHFLRGHNPYFFRGVKPSLLHGFWGPRGHICSSSAFVCVDNTQKN